MVRNGKGDLKRLAEIERLFRRALELSRAAVECDLETFGRLLAERDAIFSRSGDLGRSLALRQDETIDLEGFDADDRPEAVRLANSVGALAEELTLTDTRLKNRLEQDIKETREKIGEIDQGRHSLKAYAPFARTASRIFKRLG